MPSRPDRLALRLALAALTIVPILAPTARAEEPPTSWDEPLLEDALEAAAHVVRGKVVAGAGEAAYRIEVERSFVGGSKPGDLLGVHARPVPALEGLLNPLLPGDRGYFLLRQTGTPEKPRLELPTPSFGRWVIREGRVPASVRDSFVRVELSPETYDAFLANASAAARGGKADVAFLDSCRTTLAALDPLAPDEQAAAAHVALEGLCYGARPDDAALGQKLLGCPRYQIRVSAARLLERAGGERAAEALLRLAIDDKEPAVRTTALRGVARVQPVPKDAAAKILERIETSDAEDITLHVGIDDPRTNELPSNMRASFETIRVLGAAEAGVKVALALLARDDGNVVAAACLHIVKARKPRGEKDVPDPVLLKALVERMRPADYRYGLFNKLIGDTLEELTGQKLGADPAVWRRALALDK